MLSPYSPEVVSISLLSENDPQKKDASSGLGLEPILSTKLTPHSPASSSPLSRVVTATDDSVLFTNTASSESQNTSTSTQNQHIPLQNDPEDLEPLLGQEQDSNSTSLERKNETAETDSIQLYESRDFSKDHDDHGSVNERLLAAADDINEDEEDQEEIQEIQEFQNNLDEFTQKSAKRNVLNTSENGSYIQDDNSEMVLLNNVIRRRSSNRRAASGDVSDPPLLNRARGSVMTVNSRHTSIDAATLEIERMRSSVLNKREKKKKQQRTNTNILDDDKVLVGNKVSEGHVNYVVAYNMLTGIRVAVSRCSGPLQALTDHDFKESKKLVFDVSGNELTPSSKYDFKFKDYAPKVFRELRLLFGLDPADYLVSLTEKYILSELTSPGKSGSFFYYSRDYRFIIKTIHPAEYRQLRRILKEYYGHIKKNPNTLISQFYGLHRVKMPIYYGKRRKIYFIVMNNLFPPHRDIHAKFDLKGSTMGRLTVPKPGKDPVFKDLNWIQEKRVIKLGPDKLDVFVKQLERDVKLLIKLNIMDYSFLIGFHDLEKGNIDDEPQKKKLSMFSPISSNFEDIRTTQLRAINAKSDLPAAAEFHYKNFFYSEEGGLVATDDSNEPTNQMMYFGIIDCLTDYSIVKRLETFWRSLTNDRKTISAIPPDEYGSRFLEFIEDSLNENTIGQKKSKTE